MDKKNYNRFVKKLINLTKRNIVKWYYRNEDDPYYENNKEEFMCSFKINSEKTLDFLLTKHIFFNSYNIYMTIYYNTPSKNINVYTLYYQNYLDLYDLYVYVKYLNSMKNDIIYKSFFINQLIKNGWLYNHNLEFENDFKRNNKIVELKFKNRILYIYLKINVFKKVLLNKIKIILK